MPIAAQITFASVVLIVGCLFMVFPKRIQTTYAKYAQGDAVRRFIEATGYVVLVRLVGAAMALMGLSILWVSLLVPRE